MTDPSYGRSYWDIVVAKFNRNLPARAALWIVGLFVLAAVFAPLIANDRPYAFYGTVSHQYQRDYALATGALHRSVVRAPRLLREDERKFDARELNLLELRDFVIADDLPSFVLKIDGPSARLTKALDQNHPLRGAFMSKQIGVPELIELLDEEERRFFSEVYARARANVEVIHRDRLEGMLDGLKIQLTRMADQLAPERRRDAESAAGEYRRLCGGGYLRGSASEDPFKALNGRVAATFDPRKNTLVPRWRFPVFDGLSKWDALLIPGAFLWLLAFGPLHWWKFRRVEPRMRRWRRQWAVVLIPSLVCGLAWRALHRETLDPVDYKAWPTEGKMEVLKAFWPPHRFGPDRSEAAGQELVERAPSGSHPLGEDHFGRDLLARVVWGARVSLAVGFVATTIALVIGIALGAFAGYFGGVVDWGVSRVIEVWLCFPYLFVAMAVVAFVPGEQRIWYVIAALGLFQWMTIARLTRGEFLRLRRQEFVVAGVALGAGHLRVILRHVLPNALAPVLIAASFGIAGAILAESALSFLGLGVVEPAVSWGKILNAARTQPKVWWPLLYPGLCIFLSITCYNLIGDAIRDAVDPRLKVE
jgi:peptide/nickel transport system permease protein